MSKLVLVEAQVPSLSFSSFLSLSLFSSPSFTLFSLFHLTLPVPYVVIQDITTCAQR